MRGLLRKKRNSPGRDSPEIRVVKVTSRPGPDADYRMRRLFALLVKYATRDGFYTPGEDAPADDRPADDPAEAEASADGQEDGAGDECEGHRGD